MSSSKVEDDPLEALSIENKEGIKVIPPNNKKSKMYLPETNDATPVSDIESIAKFG